MKTFRLILLLSLALFLVYQKYAQGPSTGDEGTRNFHAESRENVRVEDSVPPKALKVLEIVRETGRAPEGYVGGRVFQNREGRLPNDGDYREFDIDPHHGGRNAERIIVEWQTKKAWYTGDHYRTFIPLP